MNSRNINIVLLFPPQWVPVCPHLSLPSLNAYLREFGYTPVLKDINLEFYEKILSVPYLKEIYNSLRHELALLDTAKKLTPTEQKRYSLLYSTVIQSQCVLENIETAKAAIRSKQHFYDPRKIFPAKRLIQTGLNAISILDSEIEKLSLYELRYSFDIDSFTQVRQHALRDEGNLFASYYSKYVLPWLNEQNPDLTGISVNSYTQLLPALTLARQIKSSFHKIHVTIGGNIFSRVADCILELKQLKSLFLEFLDSIVLYEGEKPLLQLARYIEGEVPIHDVPSLLYYDGTQIKITSSGCFLPASEIPPPCFDGFPLDLYFAPELILPVFVSRGCYYKNCAFCDHTFSYGPSYRHREPIALVEELSLLQSRYHTKYFTFVDEAIHPTLAKRISEGIIDRGLKVVMCTDMRFEENLTDECCQKMSKAGFLLLYFGLESANDRLLSLMKKGTNKKRVLEVLKRVHRAGILPHLYVFFGFPTETKKEAQETVDFIFEHQSLIYSVGCAAFCLGRHSLVCKNPDHFQIEKIDISPSKELALYYDYAVRCGINQNEAQQIFERVFFNELVKKFPGGNIWGILEWGHSLLYMDHYSKEEFLRLSSELESQEALFKKYLKESWVKNTSSYTGNRIGFPRLGKHITFDFMNYDILEIQKNLQKENKVTIYPLPVGFLSDIQSNRILKVNKCASLLFAYCDGTRSLEEIGKEISQVLNVSYDEVIARCVLFLKGLQDRGYVSCVV